MKIVLNVLIAAFLCHAMDQALESQLNAAWTPEEVRTLTGIMADAAKQEIPLQPLEAKVREGMAKNVPAARILNAVDARKALFIKARAEGNAKNEADLRKKVFASEKKSTIEQVQTKDKVQESTPAPQAQRVPIDMEPAPRPAPEGPANRIDERKRERIQEKTEQRNEKIERRLEQKEEARQDEIQKNERPVETERAQEREKRKEEGNEQKPGQARPEAPEPPRHDVERTEPNDFRPEHERKDDRKERLMEKNEKKEKKLEHRREHEKKGL